jgi:hypothetical protein
MKTKRAARSSKIPAKSAAKSDGDDRHAGIGSDKVAKRTGRGWREWFALLDAAKASEWKHAAIARWLATQKRLAGWWSQMVTVAYEQARGKRVRHQTASGFNVTCTKTIDASAATLWDALVEPRRRARWLQGTKLAIRTRAKPRRLRAALAGGPAIVEFRLAPKGARRCAITADVMKLPDAKAVAAHKRLWTAAFARLAQGVGSAPAAARRPPG